jgi:hypothetical protein
MSWILIGLGVPGLIVVLGLSRWFRHEQDLGSVSGQWLAEHRQNHES